MIENEEKLICPCQLDFKLVKASGEKLYENCCGAIHNESKVASTALELMKSRFSAAYMSNYQYFYDSWHSDTRPALKSLRKQFQKEKTKYLGLEILETQQGGFFDQEGLVTFSFKYQDNAMEEAMSYQEKSYFLKVNGSWLYHSTVN